MWAYLWSVQEAIGFDECFICQIKLLYSNPLAVIPAGIICRSLFGASGSFLQGCPSTLQLFALAHEPLAYLMSEQTLRFSLQGYTYCHEQYFLMTLTGGRAYPTLTSQDKINVLPRLYLKQTSFHLWLLG